MHGQNNIKFVFTYLNIQVLLVNLTKPGLIMHYILFGILQNALTKPVLLPFFSTTTVYRFFFLISGKSECVYWSAGSWNCFIIPFPLFREHAPLPVLILLVKEGIHTPYILVNNLRARRPKNRIVIPGRNTGFAIIQNPDRLWYHIPSMSIATNICYFNLDQTDGTWSWHLTIICH